MLEAKQLAKNNELDGRKPFVIRGHHLGIFAEVDPSQLLAPKELARKSRDNISKLLSDPKEDQEYSRDVTGENQESADMFEQRIREIFETFLSLPDDYPTEIVEKMPDMICASCAIGMHCESATYFDPVQGENLRTHVKVDAMYLDSFLEDVSLLKLPQPVITEEIAQFLDAKSEKVRRVRTTIGTVRKVLQTMGTKRYES